MGRLIEVPPLPGSEHTRTYCTTCGTHGPANSEHKPDSNECITLAEEKRWSQSDWNR